MNIQVEYYFFMSSRMVLLINLAQGLELVTSSCNVDVHFYTFQEHPQVQT